MSNGIFLSKGAHKTAEQGACAMEWVSWVAGEPHSDAPQCVSPVIQRYAIALNDTLNDTDRQQLIPYLLDCIGTNTSAADDRTRALLCADYAVRKFAPVALRVVGQNTRADEMERCEPVVDKRTAESARRVARAAGAYAACAAYAASAADADAAYAASASASAADAAYAAYAASAAAAYAASAAAAPLSLRLELLEKMCAVGRKPVSVIEERAAVVREACVV